MLGLNWIMLRLCWADGQRRRGSARGARPLVGWNQAAREPGQWQPGSLQFETPLPLADPRENGTVNKKHCFVETGAPFWDLLGTPPQNLES